MRLDSARAVARAVALAIGLMVTVTTMPAYAHHGKDFLLLETDDMPAPGTVYLLGSLDTNIDADGTRSTEITPGLLFGNNKFAFEPHFHLSQSRTNHLRYDATALEVRYRIGNIGYADTTRKRVMRGRCIYN